MTTFINELDNAVTFKVGVDRAENCDYLVMRCMSDTSESEWIITAKEADVLYGLMGKKLEELQQKR